MAEVKRGKRRVHVAIAHVGGSVSLRRNSIGIGESNVDPDLKGELDDFGGASHCRCEFRIRALSVSISIYLSSSSLYLSLTQEGDAQHHDKDRKAMRVLVISPRDEECLGSSEQRDHEVDQRHEVDPDDGGCAQERFRP